jgi:hypothetical protein
MAGEGAARPAAKRQRQPMILADRIQPSSQGTTAFAFE